ncbi:MAG: hypothetical protein AAB275_06970 [Deltaproteobacteria bacterium]
MPMDIKEIREIAKRYTPEQIEGCITQQVETGKNVCIENESTEKILNDLSKAVFIKELIRGGMSFADAMRELARRMRQLQGV